MPYETYTPLFHEICTKVNNAKDKPAKIKVLQKYRTKALEMFFKSALSPDIEWMLPDGDVPFIPNEAPEGTEHTLLAQAMAKVHNYVRLNRDKMHDQNPLRSITPREALNNGATYLVCGREVTEGNPVSLV